jgi:hypothetical protein
MSYKIKSGVTSCWWGGYHHEDGVTTMKRRIISPRGWRTPPWGCPSSPIKGALFSLFSHSWFSPSPHSCCPISVLAQRSSAEFLVRSWYTWRSVCWSVRRIPSSAAPLDRGCGGDNDKPYVRPSTEVPSVVAPCTRSWDCQVNNYVDCIDYMRLRQVSIGSVCAGT